ncbi:UNVERIFIED_CONTAM: hypothetical protein K2H54_064493 [Gekko kuhli]
MAPVTMVPLMTMDGGNIPKSMAVPVFYTPSGPRHRNGALYQQTKMYQHLYQQQLLRWDHFNPDLTEETDVLTRGPQRDSRFEPGLCEDSGENEVGLCKAMETRLAVENNGDLTCEINIILEKQRRIRIRRTMVMGYTENGTGNKID